MATGFFFGKTLKKIRLDDDAKWKVMIQVHSEGNTSSEIFQSKLNLLSWDCFMFDSCISRSTLMSTGVKDKQVKQSVE